MNFLRQCFLKLEYKQDRQKHSYSDATETITTAAFVDGNTKTIIGRVQKSSNELDRKNVFTVFAIVALLNWSEVFMLYRIKFTYCPFEVLKLWTKPI